LLAVLATTCEPLFSTFVGSSSILTTNWLVLPPVLAYLLVSGQADFNEFIRRNWLVLPFFFLCFICQVGYQFKVSGLTLSDELSATSVTFLTTLAAYFIFYNLVRTRQDLKRYVNYVGFGTLLASGALAAITLGLIQVGYLNTSRGAGHEEVVRYGLGDPNITYAFVAAGGCLWVTLTNKRWLSHKWRLLASALCLGGAFLPIFYGISRGALVTLGAGLLLSGFFIAWHLRAGALARYVLLGAFVGTVGLTQVNQKLFDRVMERWTGVTFEGQMEASAGTRVSSLDWLAHEMLSPDLYGKGYINFEEQTGLHTFSHISYADAYIYGGFFAMLSLMAFLLRTGWRAAIGIRLETDDDTKVNRIFVVVHAFMFLMMWLTLSMLTMKIIWMALAVLARTTALQEEPPPLLAEQDQSSVQYEDHYSAVHG